MFQSCSRGQPCLILACLFGLLWVFPGQNANANTLSQDHRPFQHVTVLPLVRPRLAIPSVAKSMFRLQTLSALPASAFQSRHSGVPPAARPRIVLLNTLDDYHPFLDPPRPCCDDQLGFPAGHSSACPSGAHRLFTRRPWTDVVHMPPVLRDAGPLGSGRSGCCLERRLPPARARMPESALDFLDASAAPVLFPRMVQPVVVVPSTCRSTPASDRGQSRRQLGFSEPWFEGRWFFEPLVSEVLELWKYVPCTHPG